MVIFKTFLLTCRYIHTLRSRTWISLHRNYRRSSQGHRPHCQFSTSRVVRHRVWARVLLLNVISHWPGAERRGRKSVSHHRAAQSYPPLQRRLLEWGFMVSSTQKGPVDDSQFLGVFTVGLSNWRRFELCVRSLLIVRLNLMCKLPSPGAVVDPKGCSVNKARYLLSK